MNDADAIARQEPRARDAARAATSIERRTRALAAPARGLDDADRGRLLVFQRAGERFGIALDRVAAVLTVPVVTPVPGADAPVRGVVAWRSRPIAVYDLAAGGQVAVPAPAPLVVVGDWRRAVALLADAVDDVVAQSAAAASPGAAPGAALIRAVTGDATAVVDADAVLSLFASTR